MHKHDRLFARGQMRTNPSTVTNVYEIYSLKLDLALVSCVARISKGTKNRLER